MNKKLITVIIVLVILVLGLGGYIVYDKLFEKETVKEVNNTKKEEEKKEESEPAENEPVIDTRKPISSASEYPKSNDSTELTILDRRAALDEQIDNTKNYKDVKRNINNHEFVYSCDEYSYDEVAGKNICKNITVKVDSKFNIKYTYNEADGGSIGTISNSGYSSPLIKGGSIIITDNYYIDLNGDLGNGYYYLKVVDDTQEIVSSLVIIKDFKTNTYLSPVIKDNFLYYSIETNEGDKYIANIKAIDLINKLKYDIETREIKPYQED